MESLTYITISHNSGSVIEKHLSQLFSSQGERDCLIVDNASTDQSQEQLKQRFPDCRVLSLPQNIGYGRGANIGLSETNTKYALLLNPDLQISSEQVEALVEKAEQHPNGAIFAPATQPEHQQLGSQPVTQEFIHGSCMLLNVERICELGFFDENIFLFSEESDLCTRCSRAGWDLILFPDISVTHHQGESSGASEALTYMRSWHFAWSRSYYYHKRGIDSGKKSLRRRIFVYWFKALIATAPAKRIKYRANLAGALAFRRGETAFNEDGSPKVFIGSTQNPYSSQ